MGSALPKWVGVFKTCLRYKNFDLNAIIAYQIGDKFMSVKYANTLYMTGTMGSTLSAELIGNTWTPENTDAKFPMALYGNSYYTSGSTIGSWMYSDMALFDASYLNLKNVTIGYNFPQHIVSKIKARYLRVFASGDNV